MVTVLFLGAVAVTTVRLIYNYRTLAVIRDPDGTPVTRAELTEMGPFADPRFTHVIQAYLDASRRYQSLAMTPIGEDARDAGLISKLKTALEAQVSSDPLSQTLLSGQPKARRSLPAHVALVLWRCTHPELKDYRRAAGMGPVLALRTGSSIERLAGIAHQELGEAIDPLDPPGNLSLLFDRLYERAFQSRSSSALAACSLDEHGYRITLSEFSAEDPDPDLFDKRWSPVQQQMFIGQLSQGALIFESPGTVPVGRAILPVSGEKALWSQIALIVKTRSGDRYPLLIRSRFNPMTSEWILSGVSRQISPKAGSSATLVF